MKLKLSKNGQSVTDKETGTVYSIDSDKKYEIYSIKAKQVVKVRKPMLDVTSNGRLMMRGNYKLKGEGVEKVSGFFGIAKLVESKGKKKKSKK